MNKTRSKKGFTLAELLIVVAIIAILVAIAVPLFVGTLNKAQKTRDDANIRAVRGAAVVYLLGKSGDITVWTDGAKTNGWKVVAEITATGEIDDLDVTPLTGEWTEGDDTCVASTTTTGGFKVTLHLEATDIDDITN